MKGETECWHFHPENRQMIASYLLSFEEQNGAVSHVKIYKMLGFYMFMT